MSARPISPRQMRAVDLWIKDRFRSKARALREAGYSASMVHQPHKVFQSPAVLEELEKRGLDRYGILRPPQAIEIGVETPELSPETPVIDFSKIPLETLQDLKEKLEAVDGVPLRATLC